MNSNKKVTKQTIVLLPGYDGDGQKTFAKLKQLLGNQYLYLILNYPYYRQTNKSYSLSELVDYIDSKIIEMKLTRFHLLGFSMGGFIATNYAVTHTDKIRSLTLVSSSAKPNMTGLYNFLIVITYYAFRLPFIAKIFSIVYTSNLLKPLVKYSPLPLPRANFPSQEGYPVFGTLANVLHETMGNSQDRDIARLFIPKRAVIFSDDLSFPASVYSPILSNLGFKVTVKKSGGHAVAPNYWSQVSESILRLFE